MVKPVVKGSDLLHNPVLNKGTAFSQEERDQLGLRGLLPPRIASVEQQLARVMENIRRKSSNLEKYIFMMNLKERNQTLFYRVLVDNLDELMPIVYTPTVGQACQEYGHIFRRPQGLFISKYDRGMIADVLQAWPEDDVRVIVVTDGERILGLGDQGANGMGIPVGKLALYAACAGINPAQCLPIMLDVGTNNPALIDDPLYIGIPESRLSGQEYDAFIDEFMTAVRERYPNVLIQLEDFGNKNAFRLLDKFKDEFCTFDDDIQGTASVVLAGMYSALHMTGGTLADHKYLIAGAGEAGIGIADLLVQAMIEENGLTEAEAKERCWFVDSKGLVVSSRNDLNEHKRKYAHDYPMMSDLKEVVKALAPTALIGVSGQGNIFTQCIVETMAEKNRRPIIMALSNPTSKAECTAEQAYRWSQGRAIFASGSPFPPFTLGRQTFVPGQANNSYIFPAVGLGVVVSNATRVTDEMFYAAAKALAAQVTAEDIKLGRLYPPLSHVREVSAHIAAAVAEVAYDRKLARTPRPADVLAHVQAQMYYPTYEEYVG